MNRKKFRNNKIYYDVEFYIYIHKILKTFILFLFLKILNGKIINVKDKQNDAIYPSYGF